MQRQVSLQTYVSPLMAQWIPGRAKEREVSVSIIVRDFLIAAWHHDNDAQGQPGGTSPERQRIFFTVALDALLMNYEDETLRDRTVAVYHRRLEKLGLIAARSREADDEG